MQKSQNVRVTKRKHHKTLITVMSLRFLAFTFWKCYILKLLCLETVTFCDATLSDINVVLCYVLSQYHGRALPTTNLFFNCYIPKFQVLPAGFTGCRALPAKNLFSSCYIPKLQVLPAIFTGCRALPTTNLFSSCYIPKYRFCRIPIRHFFSQSRRLLTKVQKL